MITNISIKMINAELDGIEQIFLFWDWKTFTPQCPLVEN